MFGSLVGKVARMGPAGAFRVGLTMAALLATVLALTTAAVAVVAAPALADVTVLGGRDARDPIPDFVFEEDGILGEDGASVVIDGDIVTDCRSFASEFAGGGVPDADADSDLEQARRVLEQCEESGLPPSESTTSSGALPSASASSGASAADGESGGLPETGGPALPALLLVAVGVVAASGLLARKVVAG